MIYQDAKHIRQVIADAQKELRKVQIAESEDKIRGSDKVHTLYEQLGELFYAGEFDKARNKASDIARSLNVGSIVNVNFDHKKHFQEYLSKGALIQMPTEWGWRVHKIDGKDVDKTLELERGLIYPIGAKPGTGKSTVGINLLHHYADVKKMAGYKILFLTNEMKVAQLWLKFKQVNLMKKEGLRKSFMYLKNWLRYADRPEFKEGYNSMLEFAGNYPNVRMASVRKMNINAIRMVMEEAADQMGGVDIIFVDYLQRIPRDNGYKSDMRLGVVDIVQSLSEEIADRDAVCFVMSQMNNDGNFKESNIIEEEAGIAWEISRDRDKMTNAPAGHITWNIKKTRISAYINLNTGFHDLSGTILDWD